jgi:hypothetical protein
MTRRLVQVARALRFRIILRKKQAQGQMDASVHFKPLAGHHTLKLHV